MSQAILTNVHVCLVYTLTVHKLIPKSPDTELRPRFCVALTFKKKKKKTKDVFDHEIFYSFFMIYSA